MKNATLESSYPLSPMQQGMLLHSLHEEGAYVQQMICSLSERINTTLFVKAWQRVLDRHPVLRSSLHCEGVEGPLQNVHSNLQCPFASEDWSTLTPQTSSTNLTLTSGPTDSLASS